MVPENAGWAHSAEPILATLLGGVNSFFGPALGAGVFAALDYFARDLESWRLVLSGVLLLLVILVAPGGIVGTVRGWLRSHPDEDREQERSEQQVPGGVA
jgi:branched-chain amino acid transport system permease protein